MSIYTGPVFEMARQQFQVIADYIGIPEDERDRLLYPKRAVTVSCPIHRDDGTTAVFQGYRVQHHLTLGPTKGGTRFSSSVDIGEIAALAVWMSWKCALGRPALWRRQRRHHGRPALAIAPGARSALAPLHAGDDPLCGAAYGCHGAGYGHR